MIRNWSEYVKDNIIMEAGLQVRGYVSGDDIDNFVENGIFLVERIKAETGLDTFDGLNILDVGCANGRLPIALDALDFKIASYTGLDVMQMPIDFCNKAFQGSKQHTFVKLPIANDRYSPRQQGNIDIPLPRGGYDLVVCNSLFTHLGKPNNARTYLKRIVEAVEGNATFYITWFKSPPNKVSYNAKRTVYLENTIRGMYESAGLTIVSEHGGNTTSNSNQWRIVANNE